MLRECTLDGQANLVTVKGQYHGRLFIHNDIDKAFIKH